MDDGSGNDVPDTIWKSDGSVNEPIADVKNDKTSIWATLVTSPANFRPAVKYHWYILDSGNIVKEGTRIRGTQYLIQHPIFRDS